MQKELDYLNALVRKARRYTKYAELRDVDLFVATSGLKQAMPWELRRYFAMLAKSGTVPMCIRAIDDLEKFVRQESKQLMGKSFVIQETLEAKRQAVEKCCLSDLRLALEWAADNKPSFTEAQDEAQRSANLNAGPKPQLGSWSS